MPLASRRALLLWTAGLAAPLGCGGGGGSPAGTLPRVPPDPALAPLERRMHALVNQERQKRGHAPLAYDDALADVARYHAADMRDHRFFAHESKQSGSVEDRLDRAAIPFATTRENLAEAPTVELAQEGLLKSPGHFANMMADDVTAIGVGVTRGGLMAPENLLFVQVYARRVEQLARGDARRAVVARVDDVRRAAGRGALAWDGALDRLAEDLVDELDDAVSPGSLSKVGQKAVSSLGRPGATLAVLGQRVVAASEFDPPSQLVAADRPRAGLGVGLGKDERGRAALKILVLVG